MTPKTNLEIGFVKDQAIKQKNRLANTLNIRISGFSDIGHRRALGHKKVGTKYLTEDDSYGFSQWRTGN